MDQRRARADLLPLFRLVRHTGGGGELRQQRAVDQDADHAGMVAAGTDAVRLRAARHRVPLSHASSRAGRTAAARRCGVRLVAAKGVDMSWQLASLLLLGGSTVLL